MIAVFLLSLVLSSLVCHGSSDQNGYKNVLTVLPGYSRHGHVNFGFGAIKTLTVGDAAAILSGCQAVSRLSPNAGRSLTVAYGNKKTNTHIEGTGEQQIPQFSAPELTINSGRYFNKEEVAAAASVCVLGHAIKGELLGQTSGLNRAVTIDGHRFRVIGTMGVTHSRGFSNPDAAVYVPVTSFLKLVGSDTIHSIHCQVRSSGLLQQAQAKIEAVLRKRHGIASGGEDDFFIFSQNDFENLRSLDYRQPTQF